MKNTLTEIVSISRKYLYLLILPLVLCTTAVITNSCGKEDKNDWVNKFFPNGDGTGKPDDPNIPDDPIIAVTDIILNKTTLTLFVGEEQKTLTATVMPYNATDRTVTWASSDESKATVDNGKLTAIDAGTVTITAKAGNQTATCIVNVINDQNVSLTTNLGVVINGVKWATRNVDAFGTFVAKVEDFGMFYQWNRKKAWPATGDVTDWEATVPEGDSWIKENDPSPVGWRVPTLDEIEKLLDKDKVDNEWTTVNGVTGRKFIDKASGKSLFLPAAGYRYYYYGTLNYAGASGYYWSSTVYGTHSYSLYFISSGVHPGSYDRAYGFACRCVAESFD